MFRDVNPKVFSLRILIIVQTRPRQIKHAMHDMIYGIRIAKKQQPRSQGLSSFNRVWREEERPWERGLKKQLHNKFEIYNHVQPAY